MMTVTGMTRRTPSRRWALRVTFGALLTGLAI